jgi:hypothetical protein
MSATEDPAGDFGSMTYDPATAVPANWSERLNCTLEAIKRMPRPVGHDFEALVIVIPANFTLSHSILHGFVVGFTGAAVGCPRVLIARSGI